MGYKMKSYIKKILIFLIISNSYLLKANICYALRVPMIIDSKETNDIIIEKFFYKLEKLVEDIADYSEFKFSSVEGLTENTKKIAYVCVAHSLLRPLLSMSNYLANTKEISYTESILTGFSAGLRELDFIINDAEEDVIISTLARNLLMHFYVENRTQYQIEELIKQAQESSDFLTIVKEEIKNIITPFREISVDFQLLLEKQGIIKKDLSSIQTSTNL